MSLPEQMSGVQNSWQVWGLGPQKCYERVNQTGGGCDAGHWSPHLGSGEPSYIANGRMLDPKVSATRTNISSDITTIGAALFEEAWTAAAAQRARGSWNASAAWGELVRKLPEALHLAPVPTPYNATSYCIRIMIILHRCVSKYAFNICI